jgi:hypothetical protein
LISLDLSLVKSQNSKAYVFDVGDGQVPEPRVLWAISRIKPIFSTFIVFKTVALVKCVTGLAWDPWEGKTQFREKAKTNPTLEK